MHSLSSQRSVARLGAATQGGWPGPPSAPQAVLDRARRWHSLTAAPCRCLPRKPALWTGRKATLAWMWEGVLWRKWKFGKTGKLEAVQYGDYTEWCWRAYLKVAKKVNPKSELCLVTDSNETSGGEHFTMCINTESLWHTPKISITLYINYTSIKHFFMNKLVKL